MWGGFLSLNGIDDLLHGEKSQVKQLTIEKCNGREMVGFESFMQEMGCNNTVLKLAIVDVSLSRDNAHQLKAMLRRNTALEDLNLSLALRSLEHGFGGNRLGALPKYQHPGSRCFEQWFGWPSTSSLASSPKSNPPTQVLGLTPL
jgi:hypothetical protein